MTLLNIFCPECTPWLLLMLAGAWILGWLFWSMFKGSAYKANIRQLEADLGDSQKENTDLKTDLTQANYQVEKQTKDYADLQSKLSDLDMKFLAQREKLAAAESKINPDVSNWEQRIAKLGEELPSVKAEKEQLMVAYEKVKAEVDAQQAPPK